MWTSEIVRAKTAFISLMVGNLDMIKQQRGQRASKLITQRTIMLHNIIIIIRITIKDLRCNH